MAFVATVTGRWFVTRRGLASGVLTAAGATGQLVFLPLVASLAAQYGWRAPARSGSSRVGSPSAARPRTV
jgi:hypothetical protein